MASPADGGYDLLADPSKRADHTAVFWHPDDDPAVVLLTTAPAEIGAFPFAPDQWSGDVVRRDASDGTHIILRSAGARHQLWLPDGLSEGAGMVAILPMDPHAPYRAEAILRFWQHASHGRRRTPPERSSRTTRWAHTLRALDGRLSGASYRVIAEALFGTSRVAADPWKTSPVRDAVIRLVRQGVALMQGRYLGLLKPRPRD